MTILDDKKKKKKNYHSFIKCSQGVGTSSQLRATGPVPMLPFRDETTVLGGRGESFPQNTSGGRTRAQVPQLRAVAQHQPHFP